MKNERCETPDKIAFGCPMPDDVKEEVNCLHAYVNKNRYNYNVVKAMAKSIEEMCDRKIKMEEVFIKACEEISKDLKKGKIKCNLN